MIVVLLSRSQDVICVDLCKLRRYAVSGEDDVLIVSLLVSQIVMFPVSLRRRQRSVIV
jgi:hypothetical protein